MVVRSLVATKLRIAGLLVVATMVVVGGGVALGVVGVPEVAAMDNGFGDVNETETVVETDLVISNPNPVGASARGVTVDYGIAMNGVEMARGGVEEPGIGTGNSTLNLETALLNEAIPAWWVSHVDRGEQTDVAVEAEVSQSTLGRSTTLEKETSVETDLIGAFDSDERRPVNANHPLTDDPILYVEETRGAWGAVDENETEIDLDFAVSNPNAEPYAVTEIAYELSMNGVLLGEGRTDREYVIPGGGRETVETTTAIQNQHLDEWWVTHLDEAVHGHQVSQFRMEFEAVVELPGGTELTVPLDELTYEEFVGTDIFDEGGEVGVPPDERGDGKDADGTSGEDGTDGGDTASDDGTGADDGTSDGNSTDGENDSDTPDDGTDDGTDDSTDDGTDDSTDDGTDDSTDDGTDDSTDDGTDDLLTGSDGVTAGL